MATFAIGLPGGEARISEFNNARSLELNTREGEVAIEVPGFARGRISDNGQSFVEHVPQLDELKAELRQQAKRIRRKRIGQGVAAPGVGLVQTDEGPGRDSLAAIERLAARAVRQPTVPIQLKLKDNSVVTLSASEMIDIADLVASHEQACRDACEAILGQVEGAADEAELEAIDINAGYPLAPGQGE